MCAEFQERWNTVFAPPRRSICPTEALPKVLLDQLLQVRFMLPGQAVPSICEPVSTSCQFGVMPKPATMVPRSVSEFSGPSLLLSLCRSSTLVAITVPLAFCHGPLPMRSRALTAPPWAAWLVLR